MIKNVYFHIDELGRDAITASALKKAFKERGINMVYGNRFYTQKLLERFAFAFDRYAESFTFSCNACSSG